MPAYPASPQITVDALLRRPNLIARSLTALTSKRFVADFIFAHGTPDQVAGGAAYFERSEAIYPDRPAEEVGYRSEFPRSGWTEAIFTAVVRKYGLEIPISFESIRRNQLDQVARAERKLANALTKFVDTAAMTLLTTDPSVQTASAAATWTASATTVISDIANARLLVEQQDEGYELDTMVVNASQEYGLLVNTDIRNALPRELAPGQSQITNGRVMPLMGIENILVSPQLTAGTVIFVNAKVVGTIADEQPDAGEGYVSYNPNAVDQGNGYNGGAGISTNAPGGAFNPNGDSGLNSQDLRGPLAQGNLTAPNFMPIYVKVYNEDQRDDRIIRGARWPAMWLSEPKAAVKLTGA